LNVPAKKLKLIDIVDAVDGVSNFTACAGGLKECNSARACSLCDRWKPVQAKIMGFLGKTTIADLARDVKKKAAKPAVRKVMRRV
jgi:DNA-binding IscR family transcriptional regulator